MVERTATVQVVNPHGMHLRPADLFARTAMRFQSKVCVTFEGQEVDGRSIVELLMLAARKGTQLTISADGDDAEEALAALVQLVERGFDEMEEKAEGETK
jgi:phosphocarrier protein HPr